MNLDPNFVHGITVLSSLGLAGLMSPELLVLGLLLAGDGRNPRMKTAAFSAGTVLGLVAAMVAGFLLTGLLIFIPYVGFATGLILALVAALLQFQGLGLVLAVAIVYGGGQILESVVLTPWLVGERIGLHPVAVIFALMAFGQLFGFFGILIALPASAALLVGLRELQRHYKASPFYLNS